jgi:hypothetical protein
MKNEWLDDYKIPTPIILDPSVFIPRAGILTRYGRKMLEKGQKYYTSILLNPKPQIEEPKDGTNEH